MPSITSIPETVPERSVTSLGLNYPAADSADVLWFGAHVHISAGQIEAAEIALSGVPVDQVRLVDTMDWEQAQAAIIMHAVGGQEALLLLASNGTEVTGVAVPTAALADEANQPEFRAFVGYEVARRLADGSLAAVEDNLARLVSYAPQFAGFVARDRGEQAADVTAATSQEPARPEYDYDSTAGWQDRPGSIFLHG